MKKDINILPTPTIQVNQETGIISWSKVDGARGYLVTIFNHDEHFDEYYYVDGEDSLQIGVLEAFPYLSDGEYLIKIKAVGNVPTSYDSYYSGNRAYEKQP